MRAACLLVERRIFHLPQRPGHALQDVGVGVERAGVPHSVGRRVAVSAVRVRDVGERRHRHGPSGDGGRRPRRQAKAAHDEGGVGPQGFRWVFGGAATAESASARRQDRGGSEASSRRARVFW
jgi:hypothetical protein